MAVSTDYKHLCRKLNIEYHKSGYERTAQINDLLRRGIIIKVATGRYEIVENPKPLYLDIEGRLIKSIQRRKNKSVTATYEGFARRVKAFDTHKERDSLMGKVRYRIGKMEAEGKITVENGFWLYKGRAKTLVLETEADIDYAEIKAVYDEVVGKWWTEYKGKWGVTKKKLFRAVKERFGYDKIKRVMRITLK